MLLIVKLIINILRCHYITKMLASYLPHSSEYVWNVWRLWSENILFFSIVKNAPNLPGQVKKWVRPVTVQARGAEDSWIFDCSSFSLFLSIGNKPLLLFVIIEQSMFISCILLVGRWFTISFAQVPVRYFGHFTVKIGCNVHSMRQLPHKKPPFYRTPTKRILYRVFSIAPFADTLHEQDMVRLKDSALFSGQEELMGEETLIQWASFKEPKVKVTGVQEANMTREQITKRR